MAENGTEINKIDRILNSIEKDHRMKWIETVTTILLSVATILSAWCVYEASQWYGEPYFRIEDENMVDRKHLQKEIASTQRMAAEAQLFLSYVSAVTDEKNKLADFLFTRFPPHLKVAVVAWHKLDPLNNPDAPASPMQMKEYVLPEEADIAKYAADARKFKAAANECDHHADNYMLLATILSMVLFFCGLSGVMDSRSNKLILIGFASLIFIGALYFVIKFPVIV